MIIWLQYSKNEKIINLFYILSDITDFKSYLHILLL